MIRRAPVAAQARKIGRAEQFSERPSPARLRLARAIENANRTAAELQRVGQAKARLSDARLAAREAVEEMKPRVAEAKKREPRRVEAEVMGERPPAGLSLAEAQRMLAQTEATYEEARKRSEPLDAREREAVDANALAHAERQAAVDAVLRDHRGAERLVERYLQTQFEYRALRECLSALHPRLPPALQRRWLTRPPVNRLPVLATWETALRALENDAGASLPTGEEAIPFTPPEVAVETPRDETFDEGPRFDNRVFEGEGEVIEEVPKPPVARVDLPERRVTTASDGKTYTNAVA